MFLPGLEKAEEAEGRGGIVEQEEVEDVEAGKTSKVDLRSSPFRRNFLCHDGPHFW
jgi:hypothetical protein